MQMTDPSSSSFGPLRETTSPTGYEHHDLVLDTSVLVKPMFFDKPSMTSTYETSDLDDGSNSEYAGLEREASADRALVYQSSEKTQCPVHLISVKAECPRLELDSRPDFTMIWHNDKKHFEILVSEISMKWKN